MGAASWLDGMGVARKCLADMADSAVGVDEVDANDVRISCESTDGNSCVSEAGAAVLAARLGVPVTVLAVNRGASNGVECAVQLRVYHPAGSVAGEALDLDVCINLLLDSGSMHWMAIKYPAELEMQYVRPAAEDCLGLGSSSFALLPHIFFGK
jgi:hypothetical protein